MCLLFSALIFGTKDVKMPPLHLLLSSCAPQKYIYESRAHEWLSRVVIMNVKLGNFNCTRVVTFVWCISAAKMEKAWYQCQQLTIKSYIICYFVHGSYQLSLVSAANQLIPKSPVAKKSSIDKPKRTESTDSSTDWAKITEVFLDSYRDMHIWKWALQAVSTGSARCVSGGIWRHLHWH